MSDPPGQSAYAVRLEWGPPGADRLGPGADLVVVVDVLSFTTTLTVALDRGAEVLPYRWADPGAAELAARHDAVLAVGRRVAGPGELSLSPASMRAHAVPARVVLPSPNGSTIALGLAEAGTRVVGASLRNRRAVAAYAGAVLRASGSLAVLPAGERWPDGTLRVAVEDLWGAGGVTAALEDAGHRLSPEAQAAAAAYRCVEDRIAEALLGCASGRELVESGFADDVGIAAELDGTDVVPRLVDGRFVSG